MADLRASLEEFGADPSALQLLDDEERPELLPYATLMAARRNGDPTLSVVQAVYEWQGEPLIFLVDAELLEDDGDQLKRIRRLLAMRGDAPYLGVVAPGSLRVYRIALDKKPLHRAQVEWGDGGSARSAFVLLGNQRPQAATAADRGWISNVVLRLLNGSMTRLIKEFDVSHKDAISLVGRALFTRFLADRDLLPKGKSERAPHLFDTQKEAEETSDWLNDTFNGDILPLSSGIFKKLPGPAYGVLGDVLRRAEGGQLSLGWEEKWDNLHFAHIPVGVLSQAYEAYLRKHAPTKQKREGGYFTPRPIAEMMVRASFSALERQGNAASARILDPAVGGGIFLLAAFRELVAARWRAEGTRPDTDTLRQILNEQIVGFDINEAALRFAALGLYLLSIELDPDPRPVDKLGFDKLDGTVLYQVKGVEEKEGEAHGSLGSHVGDEHNGQYDLVIGNPPWPTGTKLPNWRHVRDTVARIAADRGIAATARLLPKEALDLPFVWRAMEWTKPDGQIAFALHARLLFQQGAGMPIARRSLFEALDVTSVVNCAELRQTKLWPTVSAPFCLLFATNRKPGVEAGFRFISPRIEKSLNNAGVMRIDATNAEIVTSRQLADSPDILKTLFRGSKADLGLLERIRISGHPTLYEFWKKRIGILRGKQLLGSGNGYKTLNNGSEIRKEGDNIRGMDAKAFIGFPEITSASFMSVFIDEATLSTFSLDRVDRLRSKELYTGPQVIVHQSPMIPTGRIRVTISEAGVIFNESFYGYSPLSDYEAGLLVRYLALVLGSKLVTWFSLVTSGKFGFERDAIEKATLDRIPLPDFDKLTPCQRAEIECLVEGLQSGEVSWEEVDDWVARLYGLGQRDLQIVSDTLEFNLPFAENTQKAQVPSSPDERARFCEVLGDELKPWSARFGARLSVDPISHMAMSPWQAIAVRTGRGEPAETDLEYDWAGLLMAADQAAATEILVDAPPNRLLIGRLAQRRYWSETQARLLAQRIAWSRIDLLKGRADA